MNSNDSVEVSSGESSKVASTSDVHPSHPAEEIEDGFCQMCGLQGEELGNPCAERMSAVRVLFD